MKNFVIGTALAALAFVATPAMANDFAGPRVEVTAGADDVKNGVDATDITYGAALGYDLQFGKVVAGIDATAANVFDRADLGVGARLGYVLNENVLAFTRVGYTNLERPAVRGRALELEGLTLGGGLEVNVAGPVYGKVEYRYTDFDAGVGRHGGLVGVGFRF
jgi:outer membrane immunogenic protein